MPTVNDIILKLRVDGKEVDILSADIEQLEGKAKKSGRGIGDMFGSIKAGYIAASAAVAVIAAGMGKAIKSASDFQEANSKLLTVFKNMQPETRKLRDELVKSYNMSYTESAKLLSATGDILTGLGMQQKASLELSGATSKLAADLASFTNAEGGAEAVSKALTSAYVGEREALKTYGIVILEADVQQKLFEKGQKNLTGTALKAAKAQATFELAMEQSKNAIGDLERTQDSYANTQRRLGAATENISIKFGAIFLPIATKVLEWGADLLNMIDIPALSGILFATWELFKNLAERLWKTLGGLGDLIAGVFTFDFDQVQRGWNAVAEGIAGDWAKTMYDIAAASQEGERAVNEFLEGSTNATLDAANKQAEAAAALTEKQQKELEKRRQEQQKYQDYLYESNRISLDDYKLILDERIEAARAKYGEESLAYLELIDAKREAEEEYQIAKEEREAELNELELQKRLDDMNYEFERAQLMVALGEQTTSALIKQYNRQIAEKIKIYGKDHNEVKKLELAKQRLQEQTINHYLSGLSSMMDTFRGKSKALFNLGKAAAIAEATINTFQGATKALSQYGFPFGAIAAAAVMVQGMAQVAQIRSQSFRKGGFTGMGRDDEEAGVTHKNEYVANAAQVRAYPELFKALDQDRKGMPVSGLNQPLANAAPTVVNKIVQQRAQQATNTTKELSNTIKESFDNMKLQVAIDDTEIAFIVRSGEQKLEIESY